MITFSPAKRSHALPPQCDHIIAAWALPRDLPSYVLVEIPWTEFSIREESTPGLPLYYSISPGREIHVWPLNHEIPVRVLWAPPSQELEAQAKPPEGGAVTGNDMLGEALAVIGELFSIIESVTWEARLKLSEESLEPLLNASQSSGWEALARRLRNEAQQTYNLGRRHD